MIVLPSVGVVLVVGVVVVAVVVVVVVFLHWTVHHHRPLNSEACFSISTTLRS